MQTHHPKKTSRIFYSGSTEINISTTDEYITNVKEHIPNRKQIINSALDETIVVTWYHNQRQAIIDKYKLLT
jgi:predicted flavoprotein YhiN